MKGKYKNKWQADLEEEVYHHRASTEILLMAVGHASNKIRSQLVNLPVVLVF